MTESTRFLPCYNDTNGLVWVRVDAIDFIEDADNNKAGLYRVHVSGRSFVGEKFTTSKTWPVYALIDLMRTS